MHGSIIAAPLLLALLGGASNTPPTAAAAAPPRNCAFQPSGEVNIPVDGGEVFYAELGCENYAVNISPANGTAGFSSGSACTLTDVFRPSGVFKVRGCLEGSVTATVSIGGTVVQTIYISVGPAT